MKLASGSPMPKVFYAVNFTPFWSSDFPASVYFDQEAEAQDHASDLITHCRPGKVSVWKCEGWDQVKLAYYEVHLEEAQACYQKANRR